MDSHAYSGYVVPPHYDSLIGKMVAHGATRAEAIARMQRALAELVVDGIKTTVPFHRALMANHRFTNNEFDLNFVDEFLGG